jgi:hypothetical protein
MIPRTLGCCIALYTVAISHSAISYKLGNCLIPLLKNLWIIHRRNWASGRYGSAPWAEMHSPMFHPYTTQLGPGDSPKSMLNIGLWDRASSDMDTFVRQNRQLEGKLADLGGRKVLYSHTYYTEAEFWQLYDRKRYNGLRQRYSTTTLPTVYDKVKVDVLKHKQEKVSWIQRLPSS